MAAIGTLLTAIGAMSTAGTAADSLKITSAQVEQGQVTDRYVRAVAQLGDPALDVRLGGIYALARLAHDSRRDEPTITDVLAAYVRDHAANDDSPSCTGPASSPEAVYPPIVPSDVRGAIVALTHRDVVLDNQPFVDLSHACLAKTVLARLDLRGFNLSTTALTGSDLSGAFLPGANLASAEAAGAGLPGANLHVATLAYTNLAGANLSGADLSGANLIGANLIGANLTGAILANADFGGADLSRAVGVNLAGTRGVPAHLPAG